MIPSEFVVGDYLCSKCNKFRRTVEVENYGKGDVDVTVIKLKCKMCKMDYGEITVNVPQGINEKSRDRLIEERKENDPPKKKRKRRNFSSGVGSVPAKDNL